jgi:uncharacterized protein YlzI (FlbEa/FlbD family)
MINLTDLGTIGVNRRSLAVDPKQIVSLSADPVEANRTVVTLLNGTWFLVAESISEINSLIETAGE